MFPGRVHNIAQETERRIMSYDISLREPVSGEQVYFDEPHQMNGGTYALGGTTEAWLNITYNYARWYYRDDTFGEKGIRTIYGMMAEDSIPIIETAIKTLESCQENLSDEEMKKFEESGVNGYWLPTRENAIKPLHQLLAMAKMRPDAVWEGD